MHKEIFAHRGFHKNIRENTLEAFRAALELGVSGVELDVRPTRDGKLAVFHDESFDGQKIKDLTLNQINQLAQKENFRVPELAEVLAAVAGRAKVQIEIKETGYERETVNTALKFLKIEEFVVISFSLKVLQKIKKEFPQVRTGLIIGDKYGRITQILWFAFAVRKRALAFVNLFSVSWKLWIAGFAKLIPASYGLSVWTVNEKNLIHAVLADKRVEAIVSDAPDLVKNLAATL